VSDTHLTHVELRGAPPADAELVAACAFSPDMVEGRVGNLVHEEAGPQSGSVVEVYHRTEHDFLTASTGLSAAHGQRLRTVSELLGESGEGFPHRGEIDQREDSRLTPDVVVRAPFERDGRTERVTLASRAVLDRRETRETVDDAKDAISDGPDRQRRIEELSRIATAYPTPTTSARPPRVVVRPSPTTCRGGRWSRVTSARSTYSLPSPVRGSPPGVRPLLLHVRRLRLHVVPRRGGDVAGPLGASDELGLDADEELLATASFFCRTQDADGSWPHRVWADSGKVAPGWANARIEGANATAGPNDQLDQPASVVAFLARLRRTTDLP